MSEIYTSDELLDMLRNDRTASDEWFALGQDISASFFTPVDGHRRAPSIQMHWQLNGLSYSQREMTGFRFNDMVRTHLERILTESPELTAQSLSYDTLTTVATDWYSLLAAEIQLGAVTPPEEILAVVGVLYGEAKGNIAKTCRMTGKTRHHVEKCKKAIREEAYTRLQRVIAGERYDKVMGDCAPYIMDQPAFTPVRRVSESNEEAITIAPGDLVASLGSSRWHTVSELGCSGRLIYAENEIVHFPCRVLPKQYREQAAKFCSTINGSPAYDYLNRVA